MDPEGTEKGVFLHLASYKRCDFDDEKFEEEENYLCSWCFMLKNREKI